MTQDIHADSKKKPGSFLKRTASERAFDTLNLVFLTLLTLSFLYPMLNMIAISLSGSSNVLRGEITFFPKNINLGAYDMVFANKALWRAFGNTVTIAALGCVCGLIALSVAAYPLAFSDFYGKKVYNFLILFTMWFGGGMIPTFLVIKELGLLNSKWSLVLNMLVSAYYVIIMRSYFQTVPMSLIESSRIDGANDFTILFRVVIPLSKAVLATVALWVIVAHWNDYFYPLIFMSKQENQTLQMVLKDIVLKADASMYDMVPSSSVDVAAAVPEQVKHAVLFVSLAPMLALYPFLQRYFVGGVMLGAVKG